MVWVCACGLDIIVRSFLSLFQHFELNHFSPSIYRRWVPFVSATPLTVLYRSFWNIACVLAHLLEVPRWAVVTTLCPSYVRSASCVVNIYLVNTLEAIALLQFSCNYTRMFVLMISWSSLNMGHVGSKTRSLGQISLKPCSLFRGHSFASIFMKLHQNVCFVDILIKIEYGSCRNKILVTRSDLFKTLFTL